MLESWTFWSQCQENKVDYSSALHCWYCNFCVLVFNLPALSHCTVIQSTVLLCLGCGATPMHLCPAETMSKNIALPCMESLLLVVLVQQYSVRGVSSPLSISLARVSFGLPWA